MSEQDLTGDYDFEVNLPKRDTITLHAFIMPESSREMKVKTVVPKIIQRYLFETVPDAETKINKELSNLFNFECKVYFLSNTKVLVVYQTWITLWNTFNLKINIKDEHYRISKK